MAAKQALRCVRHTAVSLSRPMTAPTGGGYRRSPVGAVRGREEEGPAVRQAHRSEPFAADDRSHRWPLSQAIADVL